MQHQQRLLRWNGNWVVAEGLQVSGHEEDPGVFVVIVLRDDVDQAGASGQKNHVACTYGHSLLKEILCSAPSKMYIGHIFMS